MKDGRKRAEEIVEEAEAKGARLLEQVKREVGSRRAGADQYASDVLAKLEEEVSSILTAVQRGQLVLGHEEPAPASAS